MNKYLSISLSAGALLLASQASAEFTGSLGGTLVDSGGLQLGAVTGTLGYRFPLAENFSFQPEIRGGVGVVDDTIDGVDVEIDNLFGFNARFQVEFDNGFYLFAQPTYTRVEASASIGNIGASDDAWEFGGGGGLGFLFNDNFGIEAGYERIDEADVVNAALRFYF